MSDKQAVSSDTGGTQPGRTINGGGVAETGATGSATAISDHPSPTSEHAALPQPTYWPIVLAFAITLLAWSVVTSFLIALVGLVVFVVALAGWIGDLLHEH